MDNQTQQMPESVWNDPDYLKDLEQRAEEETLMTSYENGQDTA